MADFLQPLKDARGRAADSPSDEAVSVTDFNRVVGVLNGTAGVGGTVGANFFASNPLYDLAPAAGLGQLFLNAANPKYGGGMKFDGVTDDFPAYLLIVAAATAAGGRVLFPAGTGFCNFVGNTVPQIITNPVTLTGAGKDATLFTSPALAMSTNAYLFYCDKNKRMAVEDLTATSSLVNAGGFQSIAIRHDGASGDLRVSRVRLLSFVRDVLVQTGADALIEHSELTMVDGVDGYGCIGSTAGTAPGGTIRVYDCDIHDFGNTGTNQSHGMYVFYSVNLVMDHVRFRTMRGTGWCVQHQGGNTTPTVLVTFDDIYCASDTTNGIVTTAYGKSVVNNPRIYSTNQALTPETDIDVNGGTLSGALHCIQQLNNASKIHVNGTTLDPQAGNTAIVASAANSEITCVNAVFTCTYANRSAISGGAVNTTPEYYANCQWSDTPYGANHAASIFGDGNDGAFVADGVATPAWATLAANVYTLTRIPYLTKLTVNAGITIKLVNLPLFCWWLVIASTGVIHCDGNAAAGATGGGGPGGNLFANGSVGSTGGTGVGASPAGVTTLPCLGGAGGNGGANVSIPNVGGTGGAVTGIPLGGELRVPMHLMLGLGMLSSSAAYARFVGGNGGAAGGGDGTNAGGGGGGGAGVAAIVAYMIDNSGTIRATGGAGGAGVAGNAAGGGPGGGGAVRVFSRIQKQVGTLQAATGAVGAGVGTGNPGVAGGAGSTRSMLA